MIIPTPEFDPLFADDGVPFQAKMIEYIEREFADLLRGRMGLLRQPNGLDLLTQLLGLAGRRCDEHGRRAA